MDTPDDSAVAAALDAARFELVPLAGVDEAMGHLPAGCTVTVTASPAKGMVATVALTEELLARGHRAVPHLSARLFSSRDELTAVASRLHELGVRDVFVVAGDPDEPAGPYEGAADVLEELAALDLSFAEVGITGYPEGHPFLDDEVIAVARARKQDHATYMVTQICYEPATIRTWLSSLRGEGFALPVHLGLPGVVDRARLLRISMRIGLGDSIRYLRKQHKMASHMLAGYQPDAIVSQLADLFGDPAGVAGLHLNTFNEVARTEQWRQRVLASSSTRPASG